MDSTVGGYGILVTAHTVLLQTEMVTIFFEKYFFCNTLLLQNPKVLPFFNVKIPHGIIAKTVSS